MINDVDDFLVLDYFSFFAYTTLIKPFLRHSTFYSVSSMPEEQEQKSMFRGKNSSNQVRRKRAHIWPMLQSKSVAGPASN